LDHLTLPGHEFRIKPLGNAVKFVLITEDISMDESLEGFKLLNKEFIIIMFDDMFHDESGKVIDEMNITVIGEFHRSEMNVLFVAIKLEQCAQYRVFRLNVSDAF